MGKERRHSAVIMLEILLAGFPIRFKDDDTEYYYQDGVLGIKGTRYGSISEGTQKVLLPVDITLQDFIKLCEEMPFEEVCIKGCEMVLTLHNRGGRKEIKVG